MRYKQDAWGRWYLESPKRSVTLLEALYGCEATDLKVDRRKEQENDRERLKQKISKSWDCYVAENEDDGEQELNEFLDEKWLIEVEAVAKEAEELVALAKEDGDQRALEQIRKRFERFLPVFSPKGTAGSKDEPINEKHRVKMEAKRRGQRLKR